MSRSIPAGAIAVVPRRLYWVPLRAAPPDSADAHFFSIDERFQYWNFFLDFGPLNLGQLYRFCQLMSAKLRDPRLAGECCCGAERPAPASRLRGAHGA